MRVRLFDHVLLVLLAHAMMLVIGVAYGQNYPTRPVSLITSEAGGALDFTARTPHIKTGRLRVLGTTSSQPSVLVPGVPTIAAAGLPGYESVSMFGLFAPAKTPPAVIARLHQEVVRVLNQADVKERFFNSGVDIVGNTPDEFAAQIKTDMVRVSKVLKDAGARPD